MRPDPSIPIPLRPDPSIPIPFEGYWDVRQINGKWLLWDPEIIEVNDPEPDWFIDYDKRKEVEEFAETHEDFEKYRHGMYKISLGPGSEDLSLQELYDKAKEKVGTDGGFISICNLEIKHIYCIYICNMIYYCYEGIAMEPREERAAEKRTRHIF